MKNSIAFALLCCALSLNAQKKWSLRECIDYAAENNLQVRQSSLNKKVQDKNLEMSKREKLPGVSASISNDANFGATPGFQGSIERNDNFSNGANVGANILLYNNGRLQKQIRKNEFEVEASAQDIEKMKNDIYIQIAQQYLNILLNREIETINKSAYDNALKLYERAQKTTEAGTTAQTVLAEASATKAREFQNLKTAEVNTKNSIFSLAVLLQIEDYKNFDVDVPSNSIDVQANSLTTAEVMQKAYAFQPQIKAAESRIKAAETQIEVVKTQFYPTISASAGLGSFYFNALTRSGDRSFFTQYSDNFKQAAGLSLNVPIFNKGITKLQVEQAKINQDIAKNNLLIQRQDLLQNVQRAEYNAESNFEIYTAALESEKSTKLALDFAEKSYQAGKSTIYDVNIARNNYANAQGSAAQAKFNYIFQLKLMEFYSGIPLSL